VTGDDPSDRRRSEQIDANLPFLFAGGQNPSPVKQAMFLDGKQYVGADLVPRCGAGEPRRPTCGH
jgi:hypothetical protein